MSAPFGGENEVMLKRECTSQINGTKCASNEAKTRVGRASDILYEHVTWWGSPAFVSESN